MLRSGDGSVEDTRKYQYLALAKLKVLDQY